MLKAIDISKSFDGILVLQNIQLETLPGRVLALIGENGAGKSTLMKILSGVYTDYDGQLLINEKPIRFYNTKEAKQHGVAIIHQELNLVQEMSIQENIFLGEEIVNRYGILDNATMHNKSVDLLNKVKLNIAPTAKIAQLRVGEQQLVEIAKSIKADAKLIIMDEPTSALSKAEILTLFDIIKEMKNEGKSIIYISHKLDELYAIADSYTILRDGQLIDSGAMNEITHQEIVEKMVGRNISSQQKKSSTLVIEKETILEVVSILPKNTNHSITFDLKRGEILGVFGLMGSGRTEILQAIFGLSSRPAILKIEGKEVIIHSPSDAIKYGLAYVTEDRKIEGIIPMFSVKENMTLATLDSFIQNGIIQKSKEETFAKLEVANKQIKSNSIEQEIKNLSGGNQQKVILAKWLATNPKVLLLDEPTRGIDVNAKSELYTIIKGLVENGMSVIMVSSELPEILALSDRVLVLAEGEIQGVFANAEATEESLLTAAIGQNKIN